MKFPNPLKQSILAVAIEPGRLAVAAWSRGWNGWRLVRRESVNIDLDPLSDVIVSALRPLVLRWGLPPGTPVQIIAPPSIGGLIASDTLRAQKGATSATEQELVQTLPFSPREIEWSVRTQRFGERQITRCFWLPKSWVADLKIAFSRIGFRLDEIFPRSEVLTYIEVEDKKKQKKQPEKEPFIGWVEMGVGRGYFHITKGHVAVLSRVLLGQTPEDLAREIKVEIATLEETRSFKVSALRSLNLPLPLRQALERLSLPISAVQTPQIPLATPHAAFAGLKAKNEKRPSASAPVAANGEFNVVDIQDRIHKQGLEGFWVIPERDILFKPLYRLTTGIVVLGLVSCGFLYWLCNAWDKENTQMKADVKKLNPRYEQVMLTEREIVRLQHDISAAEVVYDHLNPLDPLYRVYETLPETAWIERFSLHGNKVAFSGFGITPADLETRLKASKFFTNAKVSDRPDTAPELGNAFSAEAVWAKFKGEGASVLPELPPLIPPISDVAVAPGSPTAAQPASTTPATSASGTPTAGKPTATAPATPTASSTPPAVTPSALPPNAPKTSVPPPVPGRGRPRVDPSTLRLPSMSSSMPNQNPPSAPTPANLSAPIIQTPAAPSTPTVPNPAQTGGKGA